MKTIYLVRHSISDRTSELTDIPLSEGGIEKAKKFFHLDEFNNISCVYSSPVNRTLMTANELSKNVEIIDELVERKVGDKLLAPPNYFELQYEDYNYKVKGGESINDAKKRIDKVVNKIIGHMDENSKVVFVTHATLICAYLTNYCKINVVDANYKIRKITYNDKVVLMDKIDTPSAFKLKYNDGKIASIEYICL